jgi:DNA-binding Lrp family transcriptional regulator
VLGRNQGRVPVLLPEITRLQHAHVIGSIGSGKSSFLEHCIRQDILKGRGVCVIDPHGNHPDGLYRKILMWLHAEGFTKGGRRERVIHLIDPNAREHTVGFNPLALPTPATRPEVISSVVLEAFERVWGDEDTHEKPTIRRVLKATFTALAELRLTLAEADLLYDPYDTHGVRRLVLSKITDRHARSVLSYLHELGESAKRDFRAEVIGPINRLAEFVSNEAIRTIIGQTERTFDVRAALDDSHIILVNLGAGELVEAADAALLGRLLTRMFFFHAKRRERKPISPFWLYLDECQLYLSGDVQSMLAEVRKFGLGVVLSHQFLGQLGEPNDQLRAAVRNSTKLKAVFNIADYIDAEELALAVQTLDLEVPVKASVRPTTVGHRVVRLESESVSDQRSTTDMRAESEGAGESRSRMQAHSMAHTRAEGESTAEGEARSVSEGTSEALMFGAGSGASSVEMLTPETGWGPAVIGTSEGVSSMAQSSQASGSSTMVGESTSRMRGTSVMHAVSKGEGVGDGVSYGIQRGKSSGSAQSSGTSLTRGESETFEPIYELLPSSFHSKEHALYTAAQLLRCLKAGQAYVRYFDADGARETFLTVPRVTECAISDAEFATIHSSVFAASPSASQAAVAREKVAERERTLIAEARAALVPPEPESAAGYRVKRSRPTPCEEPASPSVGPANGPVTKAVKKSVRPRTRPSATKSASPPKKPRPKGCIMPEARERGRLFERPEEPRALRITERDIAILQNIARFRLASNAQLARLDGGSAQNVSRSLRALFENEYVERPEAQVASRVLHLGSRPTIYGLTRKGARLLREQGTEVPRRLLDGIDKERGAGWRFVEHTVAITEFLVAMEIALRGRDDLRMLSAAEVLADVPEASKNAVRVQANVRVGGVPITNTVVPDALFGIRFATEEESYFMLEIDRGEMPIERHRDFHRTFFAKKMLTYYEAMRQQYVVRKFGIEHFRVATVTTTPERVEGMIEALQAITEGRGSNMFLFTHEGTLADRAPLDIEWVSGKGELMRLTD